MHEHEIDKASFAAFLTERRKAKGYTQKDLAALVYVSDKAVSKWERGLSLPDVSLLMPLAETLDVTVTELLEGKPIEHSGAMDAETVETLVQKTIRLSEDTSAQSGQRRKQNILIYMCALIGSAGEFVLCSLLLRLMELPMQHGLVILSVLSAVFGGYFWLFMKEKLPAYYDENKISTFSDGPVRMNLPGVYFRNTNWPGIVKALRIWSVVTMAVIPCLIFAESLFHGVFGVRLIIDISILMLYLASLFVPVYLVAARNGGRQKMKKGLWFWPAVVCAAVAMAVLLPLAPMQQAVQIGYAESYGFDSWSAAYVYFDGTQYKMLSPGDDPVSYTLEVDTKAGILSVTVTDSEGTVLFSQEALPSGTYQLSLSGKAQITVVGQGHRGGFSIAPTANENS